MELLPDAEREAALGAAAATVPYLTEGTTVLLLTGVETKYKPVAEQCFCRPSGRGLYRDGQAAFSCFFGCAGQGVFPLLRRRLREVLAQLFLELLQAGTAFPAAASPAGPPAPAPKAAGTRGAAHGDLAGRLGLKAGRRTARTPPSAPATSPAKSPRVAGSAESPRRVTLTQDDTDDEPDPCLQGQAVRDRIRKGPPAGPARASLGG